MRTEDEVETKPFLFDWLEKQARKEENKYWSFERIIIEEGKIYAKYRSSTATLLKHTNRCSQY